MRVKSKGKKKILTKIKSAIWLWKNCSYLSGVRHKKMSWKSYAIDVLCKKSRNRGNATQSKTSEVTEVITAGVSCLFKTYIFLILWGFPFCLHLRTPLSFSRALSSTVYVTVNWRLQFNIYIPTQYVSLMYLTSIRWDTDSSQMQLTSLRRVQKSLLAPIRSVHYNHTGTAQKMQVQQFHEFYKIYNKG